MKEIWHIMIAISIVSGTARAQIENQYGRFENRAKEKTVIELGPDKLEIIPPVLEQVIDPNEYIVGPGDIFGVNIDAMGNMYFNVTVGPTGDLLIPGVGSEKISGIILTNTTNSNREKFMNNFKKEEGGLSGKPLQQISTDMIKKFYKQLNGKIPIIGVGGVNSGKSAYEKITAGASLLQLYTGLVYKGPLLVKNIKKELIQILKSEGLNNIKDAVGKGL